jgi:hypothetical protein
VAWVAPRTYVAAAVLTAAQLNETRDSLKAIGDAWTAYTPTWTSTGTAPAIGNGTLSGTYVLAGKLCIFRATVAFGTTTTFGTGSYSLGLPTAAVSSTVVSTPAGHILQTNGYLIHGRILTGSSSAILYYVSVGTTGQLTNVSPTAPATLTATAGNYIHLTGVYEAA